VPDYISRECVDGKQWDRFLENVPWATAQHAFGYGEVLASCFHYVWPAYRVFETGGRLVAGLPLIRFRAGGPFRAVYSLVFSMYGGPLVIPEHLQDAILLNRITEAIDAEASRYGAFEARFTVPPTAPDAVNRCVQDGRRIEILRRDCPLLDLDRPLDEIVEDFHPSVRRAIRRSRRMGVAVREDVEVLEIRGAYPFYRKRMVQIGVTPKPWRFLQGVLERKLGIAFTAELEGRTVALLILLVSSNAAIFWTSAMDPAASSARPMNALMDAAIRWSHARDIPVFNFGESYQGRPGLVRFKNNWGPSQASNTVTIRTYRPWVRRAWLVLEKPARFAYSRWDAWRHPFREEDEAE
jgi:hypothetical protein